MGLNNGDSFDMPHNPANKEMKDRLQRIYLHIKSSEGVSREVLKKVYTLNPKGMADDEVEHVFEDMDKDQDGNITNAEWTTFWEKKEKTMGNEEVHLWVMEIERDFGVTAEFIPRTSKTAQPQISQDARIDNRCCC